MRRALPLLLFALGCSAPPPPPAVATSEKGPFSIKLSLKVGDELHYDFTQLVSTKAAGAQPSEVTTRVVATLKQTCIGVKDGKYELKTEFIDPKAEVSASGEAKKYEEQIRQSALDTLGKGGTTVVDERYRSANAGNQTSSGISLPDKPISVGDTWTVEVPKADAPNDPGKQVNEFLPALQCKVAGVDRIGEHRTVRVEGTLDRKGMVRLVEPAQSWFDMESGVLVRSSMKMEIDSNPLLTFHIAMNLREFRRR